MITLQKEKEKNNKAQHPYVNNSWKVLDGMAQV